MTPAVAFEGVARRFGSVQALEGVDLAVEQGEFFGLLGPNGAGKTTIVHILSTLLPADGGTVRVAGHESMATAEILELLKRFSGAGTLPPR